MNLGDEMAAKPLVTIGDLRRALAAEGLKWAINPRFGDADHLPRPPLGGPEDPSPYERPGPPIDVKAKIRSLPPTNPYLTRDLVQRGILDAAQRPDLFRDGPPSPLHLHHLQMVDWRDRWDQSWVTAIKDQNPCEACWCFTAAELVESMVRIEHCVWCTRSPEDVHDGLRATCGQCGSAVGALDWIQEHGISDSGCYAWPPPAARTGTYFNPAPTGCGTGSNVAPTYVSCSNRDGRTVRIGAHTTISDTETQKEWLENVGPLIALMDVYSDFPPWHGAVPYTKSNGATLQGTHFILIIGFDEANHCWIVKNSWGLAFGNQGFCLIAYGQCNIDTRLKIGLQHTNPDPWTKRRLQSGGLVEGDGGSGHNDFELVVRTRSAVTTIKHWWRDNSNYTWHDRLVLDEPEISGHPTLIASTYNRNLEMVCRTRSRQLQHFWFVRADNRWYSGPKFGTDLQGTPGFTESSYGPGNFEVVVRTWSARLQHYWRDSSGAWQEGPIFGNDVLESGPSLIQSSFGENGNLELVCVLSTGEMQHWWRNDDKMWIAGPRFGGNLNSPPSMIQGQFGMRQEDTMGNFELCVAAQDGAVQHWWRDNSGATLMWHLGATFAHDVSRVIGLIQGSFGNLELVVERRDYRLQHYWRDTDDNWQEGPIFG